MVSEVKSTGINIGINSLLLCRYIGVLQLVNKMDLPF